MRFDIHLRVISQEMLETSILDVSLKITNYLRLARDQWVNSANCVTDYAFLSCYLLRTFAMLPQPRMQFAFTAQFTGKSVCQLAQQFRVNYIGSLHWSKYLVKIFILLISYNQSGLNTQTTGIFFFKMWFKSVHYNCTISVWNWSNTMFIYSKLWILMASLK